jgi:hypothetical protein
VVQPGLEPDAVRMRNASPTIPHLYLACARIVRDVEHDALIKRAVYDKERWGISPSSGTTAFPYAAAASFDTVHASTTG